MRNEESLSSPPLYLQVRRWLLERIKEGRWKPGDQLPSIQELSSILEVGTGSIREGLIALEADGIVVRRQGIGTFVQKRPSLVAVRLELLHNIFDMLGSTGKKVSSRTITRLMEHPDRQIVESMGLSREEPMMLVERVFLGNDTPMVLSFVYLPVRIIGAVVSIGDNQSMLEYLELVRGRRVAEAHCRILPVKADMRLAARLNVDIDASLLLVEQVAYDTTGEAISLSMDYFNPEETDFQIIRVHR